MNGDGRVPPHDLAAERALLGAQILSNTARDAAAHLEERVFYKPAHGALHHAIQKLHVDGQGVDAITVAHQLAASDLEALGGPGELLTLIAETPATTNADSYAQIVHGHWLRRWKIGLVGEAAERLYTRDDAGADLSLQQAVDTVTTGGTVSSWQPIDLGTLLANDIIRPTPTILHRTDGQHLLYAGKVNAFNAESESGKSWAALFACAETIWLGQHAVYLDFEDSPEGIIERLLALGVDIDDIEDRFHYIRPDDPIDLAAIAALTSLLEQHEPALVVIDGVTEVMVQNGWSIIDNDDVARFYAALPKRIARHGPAVLLIDHVPKRKAERGKGGIGGQHKRAGIDGAAYILETIRPFGRGRNGAARITVDKDRPGCVRAIAAGGDQIGELHLTSKDDGSAELQIVPPNQHNGTEWDGPTQCMDAVRRFFTDRPTQTLSKKTVTDQLRALGVSYRDKTISDALERLAVDGFLTAHNGPRGSRQFALTDTHPEDADALNF